MMSPAVNPDHGLYGVTFPVKAVLLASHRALKFLSWCKPLRTMIHGQDSGFLVSNVLC